MRIAVFDDIAAHYRLTLFRLLSKRSDHEFTFFASEKSHNGVKTINPSLGSMPVKEGGIRWKIIDNIVFNKRIFFQIGVIRRALLGSFDIYVFPGEFHILSTWLATAACRLRGNKVVYWGHGLYGNEKHIKKILRNFFNHLPDAHLVYNERSAHLMADAGISQSYLFVINNSLDYDAHVALSKKITESEKNLERKKIFNDQKDLPLLIFLGRLTASKKLELLISSLEILNKRDFKINCLIAGGGEQDDALKKLVNSYGLEQYIKFIGPVYDEYKNGIFLSMADCCVSPGNIGLLAIHSLTYGTPVITHNDMSNQGPEASAVIEDYTGELFDRDNVTDLADKIYMLISIKRKEHYKENCRKLISEKYTPAYQMKVIDDLIEYLTKTNR